MAAAAAWSRGRRPDHRALLLTIALGCWRSLDGKCGENNQMEPDVLVRNEPDVIAAGRDQQIEAAVRELTKRKL